MQKRELQSKIVQLRMRPKEYAELKDTTEKLSYLTVSSFIRMAVKNELKKERQNNG